MGGDRAEAFGLFVSCVHGQPVTRYGTKTLVGAERDPSNRRKVRYREKEIVAIPSLEATKYAREYARAIADGSLRQRSAEEWRQQEERLRELSAARGRLESGGSNANHESGR